MGLALHAHRLLRSGFVPPAHIRRLQDYLRLRGEHIAAAAGHVQHMQKALEPLNVKLHDVISSLTGASGLAVPRAILPGERDPAALLELCDVRIRKVKAERVVESLRGDWADEHLFALGQAVQSWDHYQAQIADCDRRIAEVLARMPGGDAPAADAEQPAKRSDPARRERAADPQPAELLQRMCDGKDATTLPAHSEYTVLQLVGEVGTDLTRWPTDKHFASCTGLAPGSAQSGKRTVAVKRRRNRAGQIFCVMARALACSKYIALGGYYRRMAERRGGLVANKALAHKLAPSRRSTDDFENDLDVLVLVPDRERLARSCA